MSRKFYSPNLVIVIIALLLIIEVSIRYSATMLSGNVKHIAEIPSITKNIYQSNKEQESSVLFLGNSLTANAVNLKHFQSKASTGSKSLKAHKIVPDGTSIWDWYCIVKNNFSNIEQAPEFLVVGMAWETENPEPSRLAGYFCSLSDLDDLIKFGMNQTSDVLEYLVASSSMLYVLREPIRKRILDIIIPGYRNETQKINTLLRNKAGIQQNVTRHSSREKVFSAFLKMITDMQIKPIFIAMPVVNPYKLDTDLVGEITKANAIMLDYRNLSGIEKSMFMDPIHLNKDGSMIFTEQMIIDLLPIIDNGHKDRSTLVLQEN